MQYEQYSDAYIVILTLSLMEFGPAKEKGGVLFLALGFFCGHQGQVCLCPGGDAALQGVGNGVEHAGPAVIPPLRP